jgi:hypothetical protein
MSLQELTPKRKKPKGKRQKAKIKNVEFSIFDFCLLLFDLPPTAHQVEKN